MLKKIREDEATVISILPLWPTQGWFPLALKLLAEHPFLLLRGSLVLLQVPGLTHPQAAKLRMTAMILSGNPLKKQGLSKEVAEFLLRVASRDTLRRWTRDLMKDAGIDLSIFAPHSTRSAATSKATMTLPLSTILETVGWSQESTFARHYKKPLCKQGQFGEAVLA
ncbi:hypothetical protein Pmani_014665 [Petrolisthes manimaculis]|uniref:Tyr recombinase domain-containing protein n=1 Tax=Petrolisthes manimaculis TaxID=1843537 RepID=A0AAE1U846_9EUCA|nr:hypothetical protein Pmani_014665 [Petrolisthes manimaculis]